MNHPGDGSLNVRRYYRMRICRITLLLFIGIWLLVMANVGPVDSFRAVDAYRRYLSNPSAETRRAKNEALSDDNREWLFYQGVRACILVAAVYGYVRLGKSARSRAPNHSQEPTPGAVH
jgi:hypothetical protein